MSSAKIRLQNLQFRKIHGTEIAEYNQFKPSGLIFYFLHFTFQHINKTL